MSEIFKVGSLIRTLDCAYYINEKYSRVFKVINKFLYIKI